ncbi:hypothetical protein C5Y96_19715 [Blastopirellula marina]|uniref:Uncharacterized protein n=1 Tax=Blastopirellula marina TaxID=124 RepID=A0A2S8F439_9BACT|nr:MULTISPECIES: hypothetical protein [Pirellulaceae]PQO26714.1 hypothetical protein C5Y96_19715 [Blastopirellula marina]RCS46193.1 hypothetical protein DTL36_19745 [Bremerella cremea]
MSDLLAIIFAPLLVLIEALMGLVLAFATLLGELVGFFLELLFHALFHGIASTKDRYRQGPRKSAEVPVPVITAIGSVGFVIFLAIGFTFLIRSGIQHSRTQTTQAQVDKLADAYIAQRLAEKGGGTLSPGPSDQHDAWGHAIVLREKDYVVGTQVVVRSNGPDGRPNSTDDISAIRYHKTTATEIRDHFFDKAAKKFGQFFAKQDEAQAELEVQNDAPSIARSLKIDPDRALPSENADLTTQDENKHVWKLPTFRFSWGEKDE